MDATTLLGLLLGFAVLLIMMAVVLVPWLYARNEKEIQR
jgi:hypothetical protein